LGVGGQDREPTPIPQLPTPGRRPTPGDPLLEFEDIRFGYGDGPEILRGISLTLREGEVIAIMGPNGAGKSTLLRHAIGLLRPKSGQVRVAGADARAATVAQLAKSGWRASKIARRCRSRLGSRSALVSRRC
jgi:ABC-type branched-subunit amino acid transport system ATPase component